MQKNLTDSLKKVSGEKIQVERTEKKSKCRVAALAANTQTDSGSYPKSKNTALKKCRAHNEAGREFFKK